jgi:competence protein ComEA
MVLLLLCALPAGIQFYRQEKRSEPGRTVQPPGIIYELRGNVKKPGIYCYAEEQTAAELAKACGAEYTHKHGSLNTVAGGTRLIFDAPGFTTADIDAAVRLSYHLPIRLATATAQDLELIPGIGPKTADAIIDYRDSAGPVDSIPQLIDIRGIGPKTLEKIVRFLKP